MHTSAISYNTGVVNAIMSRAIVPCVTVGSFQFLKIQKYVWTFLEILTKPYLSLAAAAPASADDSRLIEAAGTGSLRLSRVVNL